jgi:hypothetical protein
VSKAKFEKIPLAKLLYSTYSILHWITEMRNRRIIYYLHFSAAYHWYANFLDPLVKSYSREVTLRSAFINERPKFEE